MNTLEFWVPQLLSGIAYGSIYGLLGLSIVLLYRANHVINLASTEISTFVVVLMYFMINKQIGYWPSFILAVITGFFIGLLLHFLLMKRNSERHSLQRGAEFLTTIGLFFIFNSLSGYLFGDEPKRFPMPVSDGHMNLLSFDIAYKSIFIFGTTAICVLGVFVFFKYTNIGLMFESVAEDMQVARLRGIRASYVLAIAWGLNSVFSVIAGIIIAPSLFLSPSMLITVLGYALIGVGIGGLESPLGAWIGGMIVGLVEVIASNIPFIGSELKFVGVTFFLVLYLLILPRGLWGKLETRKV